MAKQVPVCVDYRLRRHCRIGGRRRLPWHDWAVGESSSRALQPPNVSVTSPTALFPHTQHRPACSLDSTRACRHYRLATRLRLVL